MWKALLKKQFLELKAFYFRDRRTGKNRGKGGGALFVLLFALVFFSLGSAFYAAAAAMGSVMLPMGLSWLYFALMGLLSLLFGIFGSVFNTYAGLYHAKDNDLLLSMPIPSGAIVAVRLLGVYSMGLVYSAVVWVPAVIWYWTAAAPEAAAIVFSILLLFLSGLVILTLTCLLGWVVALVSSRVRRKSLVTVVLSLLFLGLYFYGYSRMNELMQLIVQNTQRFGAAVRSWLWPMYQLGLAATGEALPMLLYCALALCLAALVYFILTRSFLAIATAERGAKKAEYRGGTLRASGLGSALLKKELRRFLGSPVYLLNCGLGFILLLAATVLLLVKSAAIRETLDGVLSGVPQLAGLVPLSGVFAVCLLSGTTVTTSPSVSLEGKHLWLLQSYPVPAREVLRAKVRLHLCIGELPSLLCALVFGIVLRQEPLCLLAGLVIVLLDVWVMADLGLVLNLWKPNLSWTNETVPVKQGLPVLLTMLFGWILGLAVTAVCFALGQVLPASAAMLLGALLLALLLLGLERWLLRRGTAIFETL
ncbi:MAG: hypothetical protein IKO91_02175 [Oscillospiraceae bacterium]|nr:hypothetical protein [Oscillospiraceae bacterium]